MKMLDLIKWPFRALRKLLLREIRQVCLVENFKLYDTLSSLQAKISRIEELSIVSSERQQVASTMLLHRIDQSTMFLNEMASYSKLKKNVFSHIFTLKTRYEINHSIALLRAQKNAGSSYSQYGEDRLLASLFRQIGIDKPSYIDIGAHHPYHLSNTALFYENGSSGINVEANPTLIPCFAEIRPNDKNLSLGIGSEAGLMNFYMIEDSPALSTFSPVQVGKLKSVGKRVEATIVVEVVTFQTLLEMHNCGACPDFMTIDVEGNDLEILKTIDFQRYSPKVIVVEINSHDRLLRIHDIDFLLFKSGYFHYGDVGGGIEGRNAIFIHRDYIYHFCDNLAVT
jgi:FkbM family methyltransferase